MSDDEIIPALRQAEFLVALAAHLCAHPHLAVVDFNDTSNLLWIHGDEAPRKLIAWARSLGVDKFTVMAIQDQDWSAVDFRAELGGREVTVWARVDDLPRTVTELTVDELEQFGGSR